MQMPVSYGWCVAIHKRMLNTDAVKLLTSDISII